MLKYILSIIAVLLSLLCHSQINIYTGFGIGANALTVDTENILKESLNNKTNYKFCIGTEYAFSEHNNYGI